MSAYLGSNTFSNVYLGNTQVDSLWLGSTKFWPEAPVGPVSGGIFIGGLQLSQANLESILIGETLTGWTTGSGNTWATSSTNYSITSSAFTNPASYQVITSYIDNGYCIAIGANAFNDCNLTTISFPNVVTLGTSAFSNCYNLVSASFPSVTTLAGSCFSNNFPNNTLKYISLPSLSGSGALGGSTGDNFVFFQLGNTGTITVPSFYSSSNAGAPDGDLQYLTTAPRSWTINYI